MSADKNHDFSVPTVSNELVLVSAAGGTSRRNSAVLIAQADSLEKRIFEGTCDMDAGKDQGSSVPTVRCIRKRSRTCIDTLGLNIGECASFSSTSLLTDNFMRERINPISRCDAEEVLCAQNDPVERTNTEVRAINSVILNNLISKKIRLFHLDGLVNPYISNNFHGNIHEEREHPLVSSSRVMYLPESSTFHYRMDQYLQMEPQQQRYCRLGKKYGSNDNNRYNCPKCERTYRHLHHMLRHYKFECGSPPRFQCPYCEMRSKQSNNVYKHIRLKHPGLKLEVVVLQYEQQ
ncbi:hypothetical protein K0M31_008835 [Melipona bicolor]|uniref:C2H2-type domain-containing protein n=1 Tax=Melipona bicolor TaxID=60889 RepID=A0AA40FQF7_9HYME|nr:hypothetical protein K0M31_008835 [Melipona bicolor]